MEERTLRWLDEFEMRILKQIIILSDRQNGEMEIGSIFYKRKMSPTYNLIQQKDEDEKEENPLNRLLQEYPKQKNYPIDRIDEIILASVKQTYPKSIVRNDTILFNVDLEKLQTLKNRNALNSSIYFSPEFSNVTNFLEFGGKEFKALKVDIKIYSFNRLEYLDGQIFYANYNAVEQNILDDLKSVEFE